MFETIFELANKRPFATGMVIVVATIIAVVLFTTL